MPKSKQYEQEFRKEWKKDPAIKDWVMPSESDENKAYCKYCSCDIEAKYQDLKNHAASKKHRASLPSNHVITAEIMTSKQASLTRRVMVCTSHRLHTTKLSDEENKKLYGKCNNPNGHGHNYVIEVTVHGSIDPITGMVMDASHLKEYMTKSIMNTIDHKCLDKDVEYFKQHPSTVENLAVFVWEQMKPYMENEQASLQKVKIRETENISTVYRG